MGRPAQVFRRFYEKDIAHIRPHVYGEYEPGKPFSWFSEEVANVRREADKDLLKKQLDDVAKLKGNSFYGKMIEQH